MHNKIYYLKNKKNDRFIENRNDLILYSCYFHTMCDFLDTNK